MSSATEEKVRQAAQRGVWRSDYFLKRGAWRVLAIQVMLLKSKVTKAPRKLNDALKLFSNSYPREVNLVRMQA